MKKFTKWILLVAVVVLAAVIFTGCTGTASYKLFFEVDGALYKRVFTDGASVVDLPEDPQKKGHTFDGWFFDDESFEVPFVYDFFETSPIEDDTTLYAKWTVNQYSVTFNSNGGSAVPSQTISYGEEVAVPTVPTKQGNTFAGWYTDNYSFNYAYDFETPLDFNFTLYAKWTNIGYFDPDATFTITFVTNGGPGILPIELSAGKIINPPANPTKEGNFVFEGWYLDNNTFKERFSFGMMPAEDLTLYANWSEAFTITFDSRSGSPVNPIRQIAGSLLTSPPNPTYAGFSFEGWFSSTAFATNEKFNFGTMPAENFTLYAYWEPGKTIAFESNGGTTVPSITKMVGKKVFAPNPPARDGFLFEGWYTDDATFETPFVFDTMPDADITVYAKWEQAYKITYVTNGGTSIPPTIKVAGAELQAPTSPIREGFLFEGWYIDNEEFSEEFIFDTMPNEDITVYAKWEEDIPWVGGELEALWEDASALFLEMWGAAASIDDLGGEIGIQQEQNGPYLVYSLVLQDVVYLAYECSPRNVNELLYILNQFEIVETMMGPYYILEGYEGVIVSSILSIGEILLGNVEEEEDIYYNLDKTEIFRVNATDEEFIVPESVTLIKTYAFLNNRDTRVVVIGENVLDIEVGAFSECSGLVIFVEASSKPEGWVADWDRDNDSDYHEVYYGFTIDSERSYTFYSGGEEFYTLEKMYVLESEVPTPELADHVVVGWYDNPEFDGDMVAFPYYASEKTDLYVKWEKTYTITYETNEGTSVPPTIKVAGADLEPPTAPTKEGFEFEGWYIDDQTFVESFEFNTMPAEDITIYAKWEKTYTITYETNEGTSIPPTIKVAGAELEPPTAPEKEDFVFEWWYTDDQTFADRFVFGTMPSEDITIYAKWNSETTTTTYQRINENGEPTANGNYILFGEYPQTIKASNVTVGSTTDSRGYYLGYDGYYYAKVTTGAYDAAYNFSTGTTIAEWTEYYFKVEPIKWRILSESNGDALILCESIIANERYNEYYEDVNEDGYYANDYMNSEIRAWLNTEFYNTTFTELQQALIQTTEVDNSASSTEVDPNEYACVNTNDKIFLPSYGDMVNESYGFNSDASNEDIARMRLTSDYSRATGIWINIQPDSYGNGSWWLRSPSSIGSYQVSEIEYYGNIVNHYGYVQSASNGVVPALTINLS